MTTEEEMSTTETETQTTFKAPDYKALYIELLEVMEGIGLNIAVQARNQKQHVKTRDTGQSNGPAL